GGGRRRRARALPPDAAADRRRQQHRGGRRGGCVSPATFLGIDLGTSEVKLLLLDAAGAIVGQAGAPLQVSRPQPLWSEQAPQDWWRATETAVARLRSAHPESFAQVRAIGPSGPMHGAVLLGAR